MSKLKILLITLCFTLMSVCFCFADSSKESRILGVDDNSFYLQYTSKSLGKTFVYTFNDYYLYDDRLVIGSSILYVRNGNELVYDSSSKSIKTFNSTYYDVVTNNADIFNHMKKIGIIAGGDSYIDDGVTVRPPQIAPTIQGAVQGILPTFSNQLSTFLPKALVIFSMVLLVPLVPRVIRFFF